MRYQLTNLINSLNKEEIRNFKIYSARFSYKGQPTKVIKLFDLIKKNTFDEYDEVLVNILFENRSKNAFYRLKNRLVEAIETSLLQLHEGKDEESKIFQLLQLAKIFSYKSQYDKTSVYLKQAEKIAKQIERYDLLSIIYENFIDLSFQTYNPKINFDDYIEQSQENNTRRNFEFQNNLIIKSIRKKLRESNFSGKNRSLSEELNPIIEKLSFSEEVSDSPKLRIQIHRCIRDILLENKDFETLSDFLIKNYNEFKEEDLFSRHFHEEKLILLAWINNTLPRIGKFNEMSIYIEELRLALEEYNRLNYEKYNWLYFQTKVIHYSFNNQNQAAIDLLEKLKMKTESKRIPHYNILIHLNLTTLNYCEQKFDKALQALADIITHTGYKSLELNWRMNISLVEIMIRIDNEDREYASNRCKDFIRKHRKSLNMPRFEREKQFIIILRDILQNPYFSNDKKLLNLIQQFIDNSPPFEPGSNEAINYRIWLESKLKKRPYFEILLKYVRLMAN